MPPIVPPNWRAMLLRRKQIDTSPSGLARKLTAWDLTLLGMGATLGAGAYVLVGVVAKNKSGPAIVLSFLISGVASILSALCYAEFGARVPRAGSAYVYSYVTVGEVLAWTTGWQLLLEYIIGASSVARAWSGYVDFLANGAISTYLNDSVGNWTVPGLATYPDFLAVAMTLLLSVVCSIGVRESTIINNILTSVNVCVILFVIIAGSFYTHVSNFTPFAPFGVQGIFEGAATAFFAYVGFDVIATSAEEAINPSRAIPFGIIASLVACMILYMGVAAVVTLMVNYTAIDATAPLASAFAANSVNWAKYIIAVGAICGLSTSLMTSIFPMPRIVYAIATDGLLPSFLGAIHPRFGTPLTATMLCGSLSALLALIFDLNALADMMSIGTLLSYTLVAASVLVLRYRQYDEALQAEAAEKDHHAALHITAPGGTGSSAAATGTVNAAVGSGSKASASASTASSTSSPHAEPLLDVVPGAGHHHVAHAVDPSPPRGVRALLPVRLPASGRVALWGSSWSSYASSGACLALYSLGCIFASVALIILQTYDLSPGGTGGIYAFMAVGLLVVAYTGTCMFMLPRVLPVNVAFVTPFVPLLPLVSIFVNVYLLVCLSPLTWVRFAVWCAIGTAIYVFYGMMHSVAPLDAADRHVGSKAAVASEGVVGVDLPHAATGAVHATGVSTPLVAGGKGAYARVATHDHVDHH